MKENSDLEILQEVGQMIYSTGHALADFVAFMRNFLFFAEAMDVSTTNVFGMPSAITGVVGALAAGGADFLVAKIPIKNKVVSTMRTITTVTTVVSKIILSLRSWSEVSCQGLSVIHEGERQPKGWSGVQHGLGVPCAFLHLLPFL
ncbi:hypothetical protein BFJ63_vAg15678 [Fusarium oxysporum f. sp. narcissi]|uniref:Uncharacterized protein n=1 Tax=Fusarium oxysporum f. sp. narcissi TaxID=451672 RepID=A0A4Q2V420_FUSOX|nr:hypothetical protein BFJ63_vAg15678 [Fusarium oxysporum f. sp. narcissi]